MRRSLTLDWSTASAEALQPLYAREGASWSRDFDWDMDDAWAQIETARHAGRLPGVVIEDATDAARGFAFCFIDDGVAQLGPVVCDAAEDALPLVANTLAQARRAGAWAASYFGPSRGPHLERALVDAGFTVGRHAYLARDLRDLEPATESGGPDARAYQRWSGGLATPAAALLQAAYGSDGPHFARDGRLDQWHRYVRSLMDHTGCGRLDPASTLAWCEGHRVMGLALVTRIGPGVAHLAQLAVHPDARGLGRGGALLDTAMARARAAGCVRMTLLVDESSAQARRVYDKRRFTQAGCFLAASMTMVLRPPGAPARRTSSLLSA
jgi:ribosomal protein S18 acetylase RimI-like enzyme